MNIVGYSYEQTLPCELDKIVFKIKRKILPYDSLSAPVGLKKNIIAIPCTKGYILYTENLVLYTDDIDTLARINGKIDLSSFLKWEGTCADLEQFYYYDLISFESNSGSLTVMDIPESVFNLYDPKKFVIFPFIPMSVEIDITSACNFHCIHCLKDEKLNPQGPSVSDQSSDMILSIIKDCASHHVPRIVFMGGEPLSHPMLLKFVEFAKHNGIHSISTSTNGWYATADLVRELSKYMDNIQVSIHAATPELHDKIVKKKGAFEKAVNAIKLFKTNGFKVNVSFSVLPHNRHHINLMPQKVMEWGGDSLRFLSLIRLGRGSMLEGWDLKTRKKIGKEIQLLYNQYKGLLEIDAGGFPLLRSIRNDACFYGCSAGRTIMHISSKGTYNSCGSIAGYIEPIGERGILNLWHSKQLQELRKIKDCDCNFRPVCFGTCLVSKEI